MEPPRAVLVQLSYGPEYLHLENRCSVLTALHHLGEQAGALRIAIYTDHPDAFQDLPVTVVPLSTGQLAAWSDEPRAYRNRAKTRAMLDARERWGLPLVYVDGDTWWRRSPLYLVRRLKPGRAAMHLRESTLLQVQNARRQRLADHLSDSTFELRGQSFRIRPDALMWNSGLVALHHDDAYLLDDAGELAQQIWDGLPGQPHLEQFALGQVLDRHVTLTEAGADLFHYWMAHLRDPFRTRLPELMASVAGLPVRQQAAVLYQQRPRPRGPQAVKVGGKQVLQTLGIRTNRIRASA